MSKTKDIQNYKRLINEGAFGLSEIEYLQEHRVEQQLSYSDIVSLLLELHNYAYDLAMEDGVINRQEAQYLHNIGNQFINLKSHMNRYTMIKLKNQIRTITKKHEEFCDHEKQLNNSDTYDKALDKKYKVKSPFKNPFARPSPYKNNYY